MNNKQLELAIGTLMSSRNLGSGDRALLELFHDTGRLPKRSLPKRVYIASSKRNELYPGVVIRARAAG
jgi:hypothetical protein